MDKSLKTAMAQANSSKWFAIGAIGLAAVSVIISIVLGIVSIRSSSGWQAEQIPILEKIAANSAAREITARTFAVTRIVDGDTFKVVYDGEETSVRMFGIDAPERRDPNGPAATAALGAMIDGKVVRLEFPGPRKRDNLGCLQAKVYLDGNDVGAAMIRGGQARPYAP